jgi:alkylation response protein AidB-like acyl-CoA dehydrogenase
MLTARLPGGPADHRGIGLFCAPRLWDGAANGWVLQRLKDKVGTRALPTAEMTFTNTKAWPVGPLDAGLKNMVAIVLTTSRVYNTIAAAGGRRRATREARAYAGFRRAFGQRLADHPLVAASLARLERRADEVEAGALSVVDAWLDALAHPSDQAKKLWARILISIAKAVSAREAVPDAYEAMMVLGGNGIEEQFCALPRLWRDAAIMETWEGPYTLLLMQALGDLAKYGVAGREEPFLRYGLGDHLRAEDASALAAILRAPEDEQSILAWGELAPRLYHCYERRALELLRSSERG